MTGTHAQAGGYAVRGAVGTIVVAASRSNKGQQGKESVQFGSVQLSNCSALAIILP